MAEMYPSLKAIRAIGTNHLEDLVERLQVKDSHSRVVLWNWAERPRISKDAYAHSAEFRRGQAMWAFECLGARARPVVPQLLQLTTNQDANIQLSAWFALSEVAPEEFHKRKHPPILVHDHSNR